MKNWKTTVIGVVGGGATIALAYYESGHIAIRDIAIAFTLGALGALSKDWNVTGGTIDQTPPKG